MGPRVLGRFSVLLLLLSLVAGCSTASSDVAAETTPPRDGETVTILVARDPILRGTPVSELTAAIDEWLEARDVPLTEASPDAIDLAELSAYSEIARTLDAGDQLTSADLTSGATPTLTLDDLRTGGFEIVDDEQTETGPSEPPQVLTDDRSNTESTVFVAVLDIAEAATVDELLASPTDWLTVRTIPSEFVAPGAITTLDELEELRDETFERAVLVGEQLTRQMISGGVQPSFERGLVSIPGSLPEPPDGQSIVFIVAREVAAGAPVDELMPRRLVTPRFTQTEYLEETAITSVEQLGDYVSVAVDLVPGDQLLVEHLVPRG